MAQNVTVAGASYTDVPSVTLPKTGGGTASFTDVTGTTAIAADVASGKYFFTASGTLTLGTASSGGGAVTQDQDGYLVLSDQGGGGGGGGSDPWLGSGAEKVGTVLSWTINLKDDTTYDSWTASTTVETIKAASATPDYTLSSADFSSYDYCFVTKGFIEPVYLAGTPETYRTYRIVQYNVQYLYGYPSPNTISHVQTDTVDYTANSNSGSAAYYQLYYNNVGTLTGRTINFGPCYMASYPSIVTTSSSGAWALAFTVGNFNAKCDASRFTTERKGQVDSANTNYILTVDLYRVPHGNGIFSHLVSQACADINAG